MIEVLSVQTIVLFEGGVIAYIDDRGSFSSNDCPI